MIPLNEFRPVSRLELPGQAPRTTPKFPVIDAHSHLSWTKDSDALVQDMDRFGVQLIVDLDGWPGEGLDFQLANFAGKYPDRFVHFARVDLSEIDAPDFAEKTRRWIEDCVARGVGGIKFAKTLGTTIKDKSGAYVTPDDDRLRVVWETAARHRLPVTIHIADPVAFFDKVIDGGNERYIELAEHPHWSYGEVPCPRFEALLECQYRMLERNPDTTFIIAHVGSYVENLAKVGWMLDSFPNMYTDTAERIAELGRQPYTAREFLIKYQDRVLYGTDLLPKAANISGNYRFYETKDEYFPYNDWDEHNQGCWNIYGVYLPDEVLKKIYRDNALRLIPRAREAVGG